MSKATEWATRWNEAVNRHPGEYATPEELAYIGPTLEWCPPGCNWAARVLPDGTLALALPEVGGVLGAFRILTEEEELARQAWIVDVFGTDNPPLGALFAKPSMNWKPRAGG